MSARNGLWIALWITLAGCGSDASLGMVPDAQSSAVAPSTCNGRAALCQRRLNEVSVLMTHNAMSSVESGFHSPNQNHRIGRQLRAGVRGLMLDLHMWQGRAHLCHANCKRGRQPLVEGLAEIDVFLHEQPDAVVVIIAEDYIPVPTLEQALVESHVRAHLYEHDSDGWPTLGEMVRQDRRVVLFSEHTQDGPSWYPHAWQHVRDTPWGPTLVRNFSCKLKRGPADAPFFLVNHWLSAPSPARARVANNALRAHVDNCSQSTGRLPNFIGVDFYDVGPVWDVVGAVETAWEQAL